MKDKEKWITGLVNQHEQALCRYARSLAGDDATALDAVQETFLRLCNVKPSKIAGHEAPWLYRVCRSRVLDLKKKEKPMQTLTPKHQAVIPAAGMLPDESADQNDTNQLVARLITTLPERQQEIIRLKFQQNLSYREISEVLGLSESNVGFLIHTGIKQLRDQMKRAQGVHA